MSNQSLGNRVQAALTEAVNARVLPDDVQMTAEKLLARLQKPVRLALLGLPQSGKSTVLNLLVGSDLLPEGLSLPSLQLTHGEVATATCTLPDGSKQTVEGADPEAIAALSPVFVDMHLPLPALGKISVLEVVAPDDITAQQKASQWAAKRSDIALWCTQSFTATEQQIWSPMPDVIKDHALLMVTKADVLDDQGALAATLDHLRNTAQDEFNQVLPIATLSALAARLPDGTVNKDKMRGSGGSALISAVLKQVEMGRQSAVDQADILLAQHASLLAQDAAPEAEPETQPQPPAPEPAADPVAVAPTPPEPETAATPAQPSAAVARLRAIAERKAQEAAAPAPEPQTEPEAAPAPAQSMEEAPASLTAAPMPTPVSPATRAAYEHVIARLAAQADALKAALAESGASEVIALTVDEVQWVTDYLNDNGDDMDPSIQRARDTAFDAADLVQLMQMEKRDSAALEAVGLMLQIKQELQADLAA